MLRIALFYCRIRQRCGCRTRGGRCNSYFHGLEQVAIVVPDSNEIDSACRDSIALRRVFRCEHWTLVVERLYSFVSCNVPDDCFLVIRPRDEPSRVRREIDCVDVAGILPVREDSFACLCIPYTHPAHSCPRGDPFSILGYCKTPNIPRRHLFSVLCSPQPNPFVTTAQEILAIR